jgi:2-desacetyl-2-hydroxyethyl bacteriochlorophyllide A dehydrogenase
MKAAVLEQEGQLRVREIETPNRADWALVAVRAAGVCGTELHFLDGMLAPPSYPFVLGHEAAGVVVEAPAGAGLSEGDRVAIYNFVGCGNCLWCRTGREELCRSAEGQLGFSLDGGFAELVRAPVRNLIPLPDSVDFETAAILSCSGMSAVHAARLAGVELGKTALVNGVGGVGLMMVQVARAMGASVIAVADSDAKAALAREAGAVEVIVVDGDDGYQHLPERVRQLTGAGADYYFELVGTTETMLAGIRSLGPAGTLAIIGYTGEDLAVSPVELILSEIRVVTSVAAGRHDLEAALRLAAEGRLRAEIDTRYPLEEIHTALERLRARQVSGRNVLTL